MFHNVKGKIKVPHFMYLFHMFMHNYISPFLAYIALQQHTLLASLKAKECTFLMCFDKLLLWAYEFPQYGQSLQLGL